MQNILLLLWQSRKRVCTWIGNDSWWSIASSFSRSTFLSVFFTMSYHKKIFCSEIADGCVIKKHYVVFLLFLSLLTDLPCLPWFMLLVYREKKCKAYKNENLWNFHELKANLMFWWKGWIICIGKSQVMAVCSSLILPWTHTDKMLPLNPNKTS
jgi:hypothetical protein